MVVIKTGKIIHWFIIQKEFFSISTYRAHTREWIDNNDNFKKELIYGP